MMHILKKKVTSMERSDVLKIKHSLIIIGNFFPKLQLLPYLFHCMESIDTATLEDTL